jgi:tRNA G18 (ribose-2'-O)-methylase SpoU
MLKCCFWKGRALWCTSSTTFAFISQVPFEFVSGEQFAHSVSNFAPLVAIEITSQSSDVYRTQLSTDGAFVIGSERYGISEHILRLCTYAVHIPMFGVNSSMNVATSLGIVLYEWHRRFRA